MTADSQTQRLLDQALLLLGASILLEVIAQSLPPNSSLLSDSEGVLATGPFRALQITSFCLRGGLVFLMIRAFSRVLPPAHRSPVGAALLAVAAAAYFVIAFVPADMTPRPVTVHGTVHVVFELGAFFVASLGEVLVARRLPDHGGLPRTRLLWLAAVSLGWSVVVAAALDLRFWGLLERIATVLLLAWMAMAAVAMMRQPTTGSEAPVTGPS